MKTRHQTCLVASAVSMLLLFPVLTASAGQEAPQKQAPVAAGPASPAERHALIEALLAKWGPYVQTNFGADIDVWRDRLTMRFMSADATNLRDALLRETYDGAMATLNGHGHLASDGDIARAAATAANDPASTAGKFGDLNQDLVFTPIAPCRIIDTRSTMAGAIAANSTRSFVAINAANFTGQGGSGTNCGTLGLNATAIAVNLTAVFPAAAGYATAYPFGTTQPTAASINYAANDIVNNALIVQIPNPLSSFDFTIYTFAQSHYVGDIVGYFAPPLATALQCVETADTVSNVNAGATANVTAPTCATGYTQTSTNCESSTWLMPFVYFQSGTCSAQNNSPSAASISASRTCCRVPGR